MQFSLFDNPFVMATQDGVKLGCYLALQSGGISVSFVITTTNNY
jgi:hypothetical protein